jgi:hypothetical protein
MIAKIATDRLVGIVLAQVTWLDAVQQAQFFSMISSHPWLKSPLGNFYEKLVHVRLTADPNAVPLPCLMEDGSSLSIPVVPNVVPVSGSSNLSDANTNVLPFYWRPVSQTFTSLDALVCTREAIFLIQSTVSSKHDMKKTGLDFIRDNIPSKFWESRRQYLVFVAPHEASAARLRSREYRALKDFAEVDLRACTFPIGMSTFTASQINELRKLSVRCLHRFRFHY